MIQTYCLDRMVSDSACTATAILSGVKANYEAVGINGEDNLGNIVQWAQEKGMRTGEIGSCLLCKLFLSIMDIIFDIDD